MIDRYVGGAKLEVSHGIAALDHQLSHQHVRFWDDAFGIIDATALQRYTGVGKSSSLGGCDQYDVQAADALLPLAEFSFRLGAATVLFHRAIVWRHEPAPRLCGLLF